MEPSVMRPPLSQSPNRPKVSTLPRQKTEASAYLDIYKLVSEKKRLQQELEQVEQRRDRILKRLETLETQVQDLEQTAQTLRIEGEEEPQKAGKPAAIATVKPPQPDSFSTFYLEY
jgi:chromosome segregation ATPase